MGSAAALKVDSHYHSIVSARKPCPGQLAMMTSRVCVSVHEHTGITRVCTRCSHMPCACLGVWHCDSATVTEPSSDARSGTWCEQAATPLGPEAGHRPIVQSPGPGSCAQPSAAPAPPPLRPGKPARHPGGHRVFWILEDWGRWDGVGVLHQLPSCSVAPGHALSLCLCPVAPCPLSLHSPIPLCSPARVYRVEMASGPHDLGSTLDLPRLWPHPPKGPGGAACPLLASLGPLGCFSSPCWELEWSQAAPVSFRLLCGSCPSAGAARLDLLDRAC